VPLLKFTVQDVVLEVPSGRVTPPLVAALQNGHYQAALARAVKTLVRPEDVYLELGAGIGFLSTLAARVIGDGSRVHAYEADPALVPVIRRNWTANGVAGNAYHGIVGTGLRDKREFHLAPGFWASSADVAYEGGRTIEVPQRPFLQLLDKRAATLLVVDVHGGERDLLDKALSPLVRTVIANFHPQLIGAEMVAALRGHLAEQGFRPAPQASDGNVEAFVR
jgi:FkbM family methyltransferase